MTDILAFESMVAQLVEAGFRPDLAAQQVRAQYPLLAPKVDEDPRRENVLEKVEQHHIRKLFIAYGFKWDNLSQSRSTKQAPGLPDAWFRHARLPLAGWFEVKRSVGGRLSTPQVEFRDDCVRCGILHLCGDRSVAEQFLVDADLAIRIDNRIEPIRRYIPTQGG